MNRLRSFLNLERGEELPVVLLFLYLTLALTSYIIAKAVRDALFLNQFSAMALPYVYIGVAVLIGFVVSVYVRLSSRLGQATLISGTLVFFILNVLVLWWAVRVQWSAISVIFYIWTNIFGIIVTAQVWTVASTVLDNHQARRLFPLIGSGGILGATVGGLLAAVIVKSLGTDNLVLALVLLLAMSVGLVQMLSRFYAQPRHDHKIGESAGRTVNIKTALKIISRSRHLKLIAGLLALSAVVTLIIDFQFKLIVQGSFRSKDELTAFFGSFYAYLGLFSFLLQFVAGSRIAEKYGLRVTLFLLPLALLAGTSILLAFPLRLWVGLLLKGGDGVIRYSVDKSTIETLYVPVPDSVKAEVKAVIDMVLQRLSDGMGGLVLLLLTQVAGLGVSGIGLFNIALLIVWLWTAREARKEYVSVVRASLSERQIVPESCCPSTFFDSESIATIRSMLVSRDEEVVLYAIEIAEAIERKDLIPNELVHHSSPKVRLKALELLPLDDRTLEGLLDDPDTTVRARAIARGCALDLPGCSASAIEKYLWSSDLNVQLAAIVALSHRFGKEVTETVRECLAKIARDLDESSKEWMDVAEALGEIRNAGALELHIRLLRHPDPDVKRRAVLSAGHAGHRELVVHLVRLLADRRFSAHARRALQQYGTRILGTLGDILKDSSEGNEIRREIPLVLANIRHQDSVELLLHSLLDEDGLLRFRSIRALNKLRISQQPFHFNPEKITARIQTEAEKTLWYQRALISLYPGADTMDLLAHHLNDKIRHGKERMFRLLGLVLPPSAAHAAYDAILEGDRRKKASAVEYLDNVLPRRLKPHVLPLIEAKHPPLEENVQKVLEVFLRSDDSILRDCTIEAIARRRWPVPTFELAPHRLEEGYSYG